MYFDVKKQEEKIKKMEFGIKGNYVINIIMGLVLGIFIKKVLLNNILIVVLTTIACLYNAYVYAKKQQEKINKLKWEIDIYNKTME